jgi:hypothetical protein
VRSLHYALVNGTLVALDTEFKTAKNAKQSGTLATSMGMSTGGTSGEYTPDFMSALSDPDVCLVADKFEQADLVSQWAMSDTLDAQKFARTLQRGERQHFQGRLQADGWDMD